MTQASQEGAKTYLSPAMIAAQCQAGSAEPS